MEISKCSHHIDSANATSGGSTICSNYHKSMVEYVREDRDGTLAERDTNLT